MNTEITNFLNSGLLDRYVIGEVTPSEKKTIEQYIEKYPEVKEEYDFLQDSLEIIAKSNAIKPTKNHLNAILESIEEKPVIALNEQVNNTKTTKWYAVAATVTAFLLGVSSFYLYNQNQGLLKENKVVVEEIFDLRSDINNNQELLDSLHKEFLKLNNPETEKYVLRGNGRAKNLKTVAYINPVEKTSMIDVVSLPELPEEQCYKMWIQLQDKMVSLGILDEADRKLQKIPYMEDALGLSITIEQKGSNNNSSSEKAVAKIPLKTKNN